MKNKYFILLVLIALFAACTDKFEEFNTDVKNPAVVPGEPLFSNAQKAMMDQISSTNVNEMTGNCMPSTGQKPPIQMKPTMML